MPSKKQKQYRPTPVVQHQHQPQQYDTDQYDHDTDNANIESKQFMAPPTRTNNELNLLVLRRYIPEINIIHAIAPFAVVYLFSPDTQQWEKSGTEGTLFVCELDPGDDGPKRYNVVILNRKSLDNFVADLVSGEDIEITDEYVILQIVADDGTPNIYGLWIFSDAQTSPSTRELVAAKIQECAVMAEHASGRNGRAQVPDYNLDGAGEYGREEQTTAAQGQQIDLLELFNKQQPVSQPSRFASTADTDFFRASHSPATQQQQQQAQPPAHQNALLNLFKGG